MSASSFPVMRSSESCAVRCDAAERASAIEAMVTIIDGLDLAGDDGLPARVGVVERFLRDLLNETGGAALGRHIEGLETARPTVERDGKVFTRVARTPKTIMSAFGPATCARHRYRRASSPSLVPVDEQAGLVMDDFTEAAGELAVFLYSQLPAVACREVCHRMGGMTLTQSALPAARRRPGRRSATRRFMRSARPRAFPRGCGSLCLPRRRHGAAAGGDKRFSDNALQGSLLRHAELVRRRRRAPRRGR